MKSNNKVVFCLIIAAVLLISTACSEEKIDGYSKIKSFVLDEKGTKITMDYYGIDDTAYVQVSNSVIMYSALRVTNAEGAENLVGNMGALFEGLSGVEYNLDFKEDFLTEKIVIHYKEGDVNQLMAIPDVHIEQDVTNGINIEDVGTTLKANGYKEVK